jgi:hypothetical protein
MPLKSTKRILDMQREELADLFLTAQQVQRGMELFHVVSSSMIAVQDGPDAGQSVEVSKFTFSKPFQCVELNPLILKLVIARACPYYATTTK